jgi:hypothetical protein
VAYEAVFEHVVAVADVARLRICGGRGQVDFVEIIKSSDAGVVLADPGIVLIRSIRQPICAGS